MQNKYPIDERQASWKVLLPTNPGSKLLAIGVDKGVLCGLRRTFDCVDTLPSEGIRYDIVVLNFSSITKSSLSVLDSCADIKTVIVSLNADQQIKRALNGKDYHRIRYYAGLPASEPRIYISLNTIRLRSKGLSFHSPGSSKAKFGILIARILSGLGIKSHLMRNTVSIFSANENISGRGSLTDWISGKLGYDISDLVLYAGSESERRKITSLAVAEKGGKDVVVKVADSAAGEEAIRQESAALNALKSTSLSFQVPELLFEGKWNGYVIQGQSVFFENSRSQIPCLTDAHFKFLTELAKIDRNIVSFKSTQFFQDLDRKLESIPTDSLPPSVTSAWHKILKKGFSDRKVLCHRIHGDFAPWNIYKQKSGLFVYDWEDSVPDGLALTDALHFVFRQADLVGPWPGSMAILERLREVCIRCFSEIGFIEKNNYENYILAWMIKEYAENYSERILEMIEYVIYILE